MAYNVLEKLNSFLSFFSKSKVSDMEIPLKSFPRKKLSLKETKSTEVHFEPKNQKVISIITEVLPQEIVTILPQEKKIPIATFLPMSLIIHSHLYMKILFLEITRSFDTEDIHKKQHATSSITLLQSEDLSFDVVEQLSKSFSLDMNAFLIFKNNLKSPIFHKSFSRLRDCSCDNVRIKNSSVFETSRWSLTDQPLIDRCSVVTKTVNNFIIEFVRGTPSHFLAPNPFFRTFGFEQDRPIHSLVIKDPDKK